MSPAAACFAAAGDAKGLVFDCPSLPIRPQRVLTDVPSVSISQNLFDVPSLSSKRLMSKQAITDIASVRRGVSPGLPRRGFPVTGWRSAHVRNLQLRLGVSEM